MSTGSTATRVLVGTKWWAGGMAAQKVIQTLTLVALARLLEPDAFGVVAATSFALLLLVMTKDLGMPVAVVQRRTDLEEAINHLFYWSWLTSVVLYLLVVAIAPAAGRFFGDARVGAVVPVMALCLFTQAACVVPETLAARKLRVRDQAAVALIEVTASGIASVGLALAGLGVWAIVVGTLVGWVARSLAWWATSSWRPTRRWSRRVARELTGFGLRIASSPLLTEGLDALTRGVIGRVQGVSALGLFDLSVRAINLPVRQLATTFMQRVALPAFCIEQGDRARIVSWHLTSVRYLCLVMAPAVVLLALEAEHLVELVLGPSWQPAVPLIRVLAPAMFLRPLADARPLFVALGRADLVLKVSLVGMGITIPVLLVTAPFGLVAIGAGLMLSYVVSAVVNLVVVHRVAEIAWADLLRPVGFPIPAAAVMAVAMVVGKQALSQLAVGDGLTGLALRGLFGGIAFAAVVQWQDPGALQEIRRLARSAFAGAPSEEERRGERPRSLHSDSD